MQAGKGRFFGAFLAEGELHIHESGAAAVGDTMGGGKLFVHADAGEAAGYGMWGGCLSIQGNAGPRSGMHMKADAVLLIGGCAGEFLGEYQAGGTIIVLGLGQEKPLLSPGACAGMHGGKVYLRCRPEDAVLPGNAQKQPAADADIALILPHLQSAARHFDWDLEQVLQFPFTVVTPVTHRPYKNLYTPA